MTPIKKTISGIFWKIGSFFRHVSKKVYVSNEEKLTKQQADRAKPWFDLNGDRNLRVEYDLNETSTVVDVGGYEGDWTSDIYSRYLCSISLFEPVKSFFERTQKRFERNKKITCYNLGLSDKTKETDISLQANSSSLFKEGSELEKIKLVDAVNFFKKNNIQNIDLIKINIEGGEYSLLEHFIQTGFVKNIKNIQVQFHDFVPDAKKKMEMLHKHLSVTHKPTYQFEFMWENWTKI